MFLSFRTETNVTLNINSMIQSHWKTSQSMFRIIKKCNLYFRKYFLAFHSDCRNVKMLQFLSRGPDGFGSVSGTRPLNYDQINNDPWPAGAAVHRLVKLRCNRGGSEVLSGQVHRQQHQPQRRRGGLPVAGETGASLRRSSRRHGLWWERTGVLQFIVLLYNQLPVWFHWINLFGN